MAECRSGWGWNQGCWGDQLPEPGGGVEQAGAPKGDQEGHLPHPPFSTNESLLRSERGRG